MAHKRDELSETEQEVLKTLDEIEASSGNLVQVHDRAMSSTDRKRKQLLLTWHPHRYANLTNNPKKYMKMYKQGEAMTREIQSAYEVLIGKLEKKEG